jgi:hypothetical protein
MDCLRDVGSGGASSLDSCVREGMPALAEQEPHLLRGDNAAGLQALDAADPCPDP